MDLTKNIIYLGDAKNNSGGGGSVGTLDEVLKKGNTSSNSILLKENDQIVSTNITIEGADTSNQQTSLLLENEMVELTSQNRNNNNSASVRLNGDSFSSYEETNDAISSCYVSSKHINMSYTMTNEEDEQEERLFIVDLTEPIVRLDESMKSTWQDALQFDKKLDKLTGTSDNPLVYVKKADGTQGTIVVSEEIVNEGLPLRSLSGQINVPLSPLDLNNATSKKYVDSLLYIKDWAVSDLDIVIPSCLEDIENVAIPKLTFKITGNEAIEYKVFNLLTYEIFDINGNRINFIPVCQFTGQNGTELNVRGCVMGQNSKVAHRIVGKVLLMRR